jgi:acyl-coenzyme A thioesterase PaaI-like protein
MRGRTAIAIEDHRKKKLATHFARLEHMYLSVPFNDLYDPGVRVEESEAELVIPIRDELRLPSGDLAESVYMKVMNDAAVLAVNALEEDRLVATLQFAVQLTRHQPSGDLVARGLVVSHSGGQYEAQCVLTDADGMEIGRGEGTFVVSETALSPTIGYA